MKSYETYKESKKTAIGLIPSEWNITSIKNILEIPITDGPHTTPEFYDEGIPFLSAEAVKNGKLDFNKKRGFISEEDFKLYSQKYLPKKGDIFMVKSGATTGNTAMVETDDIFNIWSPLAVFRAKNEKVFPKYLHYYLMSPNFKSLVEISWSYGTQQNIGMGVLSNLPISYPSTEIQTQIANYLDHKTAIIDALIDKKEQLIKKLQAQRQAIINEAVTKGLNPNAKMKDSGIKWLGEIPEHWGASFLKRFTTKITDGAHHSPKTQFVGRNYISVKDVSQFGEIDLENCKKILDDDFELLVKNGCQPQRDDVLLTKDGTIGRAAIVKENNFVILSSLGLISPNKAKLNSQFLRYFLICDLNVTQMFSLIAGAALTRLTIDKIKHLIITVPPLNEQEEIVKYLNNTISIFDKIIKKSSEQIKKLKSYRQSVISEAVTGKIDVRDWQKHIV